MKELKVTPVETASPEPASNIGGGGAGGGGIINSEGAGTNRAYTGNFVFVPSEIAGVDPFTIIDKLQKRAELAESQVLS